MMFRYLSLDPSDGPTLDGHKEHFLSWLITTTNKQIHIIILCDLYVCLLEFILQKHKLCVKCIPEHM